jgi:hypothetical protein
MLLAVTPLKIETLQIHDNETTDKVHVLIPTHVAPIVSTEVTQSVKRFGLIREPEIREGREEIELQTTTVTATPEHQTEDLGRATGTDSVTEDAKRTTAKPSFESTGPATPQSTLPPLTTTMEPGTSSKAAESNRLQGQENGDEISLSMSDPITTTTTTINRSSESEPETTTTLPPPIYVSSGSEQQHLKLQLTEDFVRFLNSHYYEKPIFQ